MTDTAHLFVAPAGYVASAVRPDGVARRGRSGLHHLVFFDLTNAGTTNGQSQIASLIESSMHELFTGSVAASASTGHAIAAKDGAFDSGEGIAVC